jgi:hypothetical protein
MASTLILDRSDEAVDQMVTAWKNGAQYRVALRIEQIASDPATSTFRVAEVTNETEGAETPTEEAAVEAEEAPSPKSKPAVQVKY